MWNLIFFFLVGIFTGYLIKKKENIIKMTSKFTEVSVFLLLFWLGYLMGRNKNVIENLMSMGIDALVLSIFSIIGSVLFIIPLQRKIK